MRFFGVYRDDGIGIFNGVLSVEEATQWLHNFQLNVNKIAEGPFLQFTMELWQPGSSQTTAGDPKISIFTKEHFPFLDSAIYWNKENGKLAFGVHLKENQELKFLNKGKLPHTRMLQG